MNDRDLEDLIRASNPARTPLSEPLSARQRGIMSRILAEQPTVRKRRTPRKLVLAIASPLAVMLAALVLFVAIFQPLDASPAAAFGPPPLRYESTSETVREVFGLAQQRLASAGNAAPFRASVTTSWNLSVDEAGEPERVQFITPLVTELEWSDDLAGRVRTIAGESFNVVGDNGQGTPDGSAAQGTVLDERVFAPGEYPVVNEGAASYTFEDFRRVFNDYAPDKQHPGDALFAVQNLLSEWTLSATQHGEMLQALLEYDELTMLGSTTDRLGREVIGIAAPASNGRVATLLISTHSGHILGVERTVLSDDAALGVPANTVVSYTLWKEQR